MHFKFYRNIIDMSKIKAALLKTALCNFLVQPFQQTNSQKFTKTLLTLK